MVKNGICLGGASKEYALFFFRESALKGAPIPPMSRIGPDNTSVGDYQLDVGWHQKISMKLAFQITLKNNSLL